MGAAIEIALKLSEMTEYLDANTRMYPADRRIYTENIRRCCSVLGRKITPEEAMDAVLEQLDWGNRQDMEVDLSKKAFALFEKIAQPLKDIISQMQQVQPGMGIS